MVGAAALAETAASMVDPLLTGDLRPAKTALLTLTLQARNCRRRYARPRQRRLTLPALAHR